MSDLPVVNLRKGGVINLRKSDSLLKKAIIGLGWKVNQQRANVDFDLDVCCFMLDNTDTLLSDRHFIFYNNKVSQDSSIKHSGDNKTGGDGDDDEEQIVVEFDKIQKDVVKLVFTVTIHEARARRQNFGQVSNAYVRLVNLDTKKEQIRFNLSDEQSNNTGMVACEIHKDESNDWSFTATGQGYTYELDSFVNKYYAGGSKY